MPVKRPKRTPIELSLDDPLWLMLAVVCFNQAIAGLDILPIRYYNRVLILKSELLKLLVEMRRHAS